MTTFLTLLFTAVAILLILVVLVQRGRGGGLSGAFGSGGGSTSAFGTKTGDVFTWATVILFAVFMLLAIWLNMRFPTIKEEYSGVTKVQPAGGTGEEKPATAPSGTLLETPRPASASTAPAAPVVPVTRAAPATAAATSTSQPK
jgi:preprotein translocase subunit SecG